MHIVLQYESTHSSKDKEFLLIPHPPTPPPAPGSLSRYISWNEFVTDMLSRGEVNQIVILPDADLVQVQLYPGASVRGAQTKVSRQGLLTYDLQSFVSSSL